MCLSEKCASRVVSWTSLCVYKHTKWLNVQVPFNDSQVFEGIFKSRVWPIYLLLAFLENILPYDWPVNDFLSRKCCSTQLINQSISPLRLVGCPQWVIIQSHHLIELVWCWAWVLAYEFVLPISLSMSKIYCRNVNIYHIISCGNFEMYIYA